MGYDLHIGDSYKNHEYRLSLSESMHEELFSLLKAERISLPIFGRMSDIYSDAKVTEEDLHRFIEEINIILGIESTSVSLANTLCEIKYAVKEAIESKKSVYWFCD